MSNVMFKNEREKKVKQKRTEQEASNKLKQVFVFAKIHRHKQITNQITGRKILYRLFSLKCIYKV